MRVLDYDQLNPVKGIRYTRDHLRRLVKAGKFPAPIMLSERRIAWREDVVDAWLADRSVKTYGQKSGTASP